MNFEEKILEITMNDPEQSAQDFHKITELISHSALNYGGKCVQTLAVPKIITPKQFYFIKDFIAACFSLFNKVIDQYMTNSEYRKLFAFSPELEDLILSSGRNVSPIPMSRIDFFFNEKTQEIKLCEVNTDGTSAMNEDRILGELLQYNSAFQTFVRDKNYYQYELFDSWVAEFQSIYRAFSKNGNLPQVAIVDFLDKGTVNEFIQFQKAFEKQHIRTEICDIRELTYENAILKTPSGMRVDAIYRRAVTVDIMDNYSCVMPFIRAAKDRAVCIVGTFCTQILHNKRIFYILQHPATLSFLAEDEANFVKEHVPSTFLLSEEIVRSTTALSDREQWIIKPCDSYASKGVYAGIDCNEEKWSRVVRENIGNDYLLQKFTKPYKTANIDFSVDNAAIRDYSNITGVFCYNEKPYGIYSRLSKGEIISSQYDEKSVATILYNE
jgi:hypothetical protein